VEGDGAVFGGDSLIDLLGVVFVNLDESIFNCLALRDIYHVDLNGKIGGAILRDHNIEISLSLLNLEECVEFWVTGSLDVQQVLSFDEVGDPEVALGVPEDFEFEFVKLRGVFFLIFVFLRDFGHENRLDVGGVRPDLDLLARGGLAEDVECDAGVGAGFQAHKDDDFILVLVVDDVNRSVARLELLVAFDLNLVHADRHIREGA
jgi:hypothetical protein